MDVNQHERLSTNTKIVKEQHFNCCFWEVKLYTPNNMTIQRFWHVVLINRTEMQVMRCFTLIIGYGLCMFFLEKSYNGAGMSSLSRNGC
jgi:hypothetical protein